jgi:Asp-tRNA(Asn)/Glu-tRNA(Gln) amidotransferase A subunit family amidase
LWNAVATAEGYASEGPLLERAPEAIEADTAQIIGAGRAVSARDYLDAQHERTVYTHAWLSFFDDFDVLLTPMMQMTAFPVGIMGPAQIGGVAVDPFFDDWCHTCLPANLTGLPAFSLPNGFGDDGLPVAIQLMGARFSEPTLLAVAAAWERLAPWAGARPPL